MPIRQPAFRRFSQLFSKSHSSCFRSKLSCRLSHTEVCRRIYRKENLLFWREDPEELDENDEEKSDEDAGE